jgi:hypothetical protein
LRYAAVALCLVVAACSSVSVADRDTERDTPGATSSSAAGSGGCDRRGSDLAWTNDVSATAAVLAEGDGSSPRVEAVVYPHPDYEGNPWSQWGQGLVLDDGRFLSAIGDHQGPDGNSFLFQYDPATMTLTEIMDVLAMADHTEGDWGFGKIHAQMVRGPCDNVLVTTYWGTLRGLEFTDGYQGDLLISIDPNARTIGTRGVAHPEHGVPSLAASPDGRLLYMEAADPMRDGDAGAFVVRDATDGTTIFVDDDPSHTGFRSMAVLADGRALYSIGDGRLAVYDPASNTSSRSDAELPGEWLRAASVPGEDGTVYGVTRDPDVFFAMDPDGAVRTLGEARAYTASIALSPDGSTVYSVPDAHGGSWELGAPLVALDTTTGDQETVIELQPLAEEHLGLRLGGSYDVAVDDSGKTIYVGMNAGEAGDDSGFGQVVLLVITLP